MKHIRKTANTANSNSILFRNERITDAGEKGGDRLGTSSGQTPGGAAKNRQAASGRDDHKGDDRVHRETNNEGGWGGCFSHVVRPTPARLLFSQTRVEHLHAPTRWAACPSLSFKLHKVIHC